MRPRPGRTSWVVLAVTAALTYPATPASARPAAPASARTANDYVVVLKDAASPRTTVSALASHARLRYRFALNGFAARLDAAQLSAVRSDPAVARVVRDVRITKATDPLLHGAGTQLRPPWGLDRIDQRTLPYDASYSPAGDGSGVTVYVLDTGLRATHEELAGRVGTGINVETHALTPDPDPGAGSGTRSRSGTRSATGSGSDPDTGPDVDPADTSDCDGHGTHVSATIGGTRYGVAKAVTVVPVRVLDCEGSGTLSGVLAGVDWVTAHHRGPSVANMSLAAPAGPDTTVLENAIRASIASGVTYAVAGGNESDDACLDSPADVGEAITVGASSAQDRAAWFSNFGSCIDLYAPGVDVLSATNSGDGDTAELSGTSMATPHVAGAAALILQAHPSDTPADVRAELVSDAAAGVLAGIEADAGDPNLLLQVPPVTTPGGDTTAPTVTSLTGSVQGATVVVRAIAEDPPGAPALDPGATPKSGTDPGNGPSTDPGNGSGSAPGTDPGNGPGTDPGREASGVKGFSYVWSHSRAPATTPQLGSLDGVLTARPGEGTWYVHVRAVDLAGNYGSVSTAGPFLVDTAAPRVVRVRLTTRTANRLLVQLIGADTGSGLAGFAVVWNTSRSSLRGAVGFAGTGGSVMVRSPRLADGRWFVHLRARDRCGHWSGWLTVGPLRTAHHGDHGRSSTHRT